VKAFVSIIICTYNRAALLKRTLKSLSCQTLKPEDFEVIVVDDGSRDSTAEVCETLSHGMPNLKYISTGRNRGTGCAANVGVQSSKGDYLIFTDDDCIARNDWAESMRAALAKYPLIAGTVASPTSSFIKLCHNISEFHPFMPGRKAGTVDFIAGANMGFRRSLYEELKGFPDQKVISPDMYFILKARQEGHQIYFVPEAVITHDHNRTGLIDIFRYAADHASETILLRNRYRLLLRTPFILRSPFLILAAAPAIALKVTAGIYWGNMNNVKFFWTAPVVYALKLAWCWGAARGLRNWNNSRRKDEQRN
jgi:glycosyltransferase involved in cell wall biosynthesis